MPYYQEFRAPDVALATVDGRTYPVMRETSKAMTFRSKPHSKSLSSTELLPMQADPYAYFLESTSRRDYQERLKERGMSAQGAPDRGNAFELVKHTIHGSLYNIERLNVPSGSTERLKNVRVYPSWIGPDPLGHVHDGHINTPASYKESGLETFAQQAYNRTAPTSVVFDAAQFLGELREGLPKFALASFQNGAKFYKGLGSDYLSAEFGWKPFIADLINFGTALADATKLLTNSGKRVHRTFSLPPVSQADERFLSGPVYADAGQPGLLDLKSYQALGYPSVKTFSTQIGTTGLDYLKSRNTRRWFEGEFTSFLPLGFDPSNYFDRLNQLVKLTPTPSTLWQLAPWSWMIDWAFKIEDTIAANEKAANDLLVMHYGYAMEESVYTTAFSWSGAQTGDAWHTKTTGLPVKGQVVASTVFKRRLRANPYGFRVGGGQALSEGKIAILGALGLSRSR